MRKTEDERQEVKNDAMKQGTRDEANSYRLTVARPSNVRFSIHFYLLSTFGPFLLKRFVSFLFLFSVIRQQPSRMALNEHRNELTPISILSRRAGKWDE